MMSDEVKKSLTTVLTMNNDEIIIKPLKFKIETTISEHVNTV